MAWRKQQQDGENDPVLRNDDMVQAIKHDHAEAVAKLLCWFRNQAAMDHFLHVAIKYNALAAAGVLLTLARPDRLESADIFHDAARNGSAKMLHLLTHSAIPACFDTWHSQEDIAGAVLGSAVKSGSWRKVHAVLHAKQFDVTNSLKRSILLHACNPASKVARMMVAHVLPDVLSNSSGCIRMAAAMYRCVAAAVPHAPQRITWVPPVTPQMARMRRACAWFALPSTPAAEQRHTTPATASTGR